MSQLQNVNTSIVEESFVEESFVRGIASKYKHLSEQDIKEGLEIMNAFYVADEDGRRALKVYSGCLTDMALYRNTKQTA